MCQVNHFLDYGNPFSYFFNISPPLHLKNLRVFCILPPPILLFTIRIDKQKKLWYISNVKGNDEDMRSGKASQREIHLGARILQTSLNDTTSELSVGNSRSGAPVKATMSDGLTTVTRVEPWNTFVSHP